MSGDFLFQSLFLLILLVMNDVVMLYIISLCKREGGAAGTMAQSIKCVLCKCEDMCLDSRQGRRKLGMVTHVCHSGAGRGRDRRIPGVYWLASPAEAVNSRFSKRL